MFIVELSSHDVIRRHLAVVLVFEVCVLCLYPMRFDANPFQHKYCMLVWHVMSI